MRLHGRQFGTCDLETKKRALITAFFSASPQRRKEVITGWRLSLYLVMGILTACSPPVPRLNRGYLPLRYSIDSSQHSRYTRDDLSLKFIRLNDNQEINRRVISLWREGAFDRIYAKEHPINTFTDGEIEELNDFLNGPVAIYFISLESRRSSPLDLPRFFERSLRCTPLTDMEIEFLMNSRSEIAFPKKMLTLLLISSHELSLLNGATPLYPKVLSPFLRKKYALPELSSIALTNVLSLKNGTESLHSARGFLFCRESGQFLATD